MAGGTIERALLSVTNKDGIVELARALAGSGVELLSTGGTARVLREAGLEVRDLSDFTGTPEMLDGRVKTLHPKVFGGILARRDVEEHRKQMGEHGIEPIDLVVVNLYDFASAARRQAEWSDLIENIDIGGPSLLRAAAKNHADVAVVVEPEDYDRIAELLRSGGEIPQSLRAELALKVYAHTSRYDAMIARVLGQKASSDGVPVTLGTALELRQELRYGENPHQQAGWYQEAGSQARGLGAVDVHQGKELSYNNLLDLDAAFGLSQDVAAQVDRPAAIYIKHNNPCGVALGADGAEALARSRACDPLSAFGAVVCLTVPMDEAAANVLNESFVEAILAPGYDEGARRVLAKKKNLRVLELDPSHWALPEHPPFVLRPIAGGFLAQTQDQQVGFLREVPEARVATKRAPTEEEAAGLRFAWTVAKHVRSNAIVFSSSDAVVAVGAGQMSRVDSVKICRLKAGDALQGSVVASDAFFPFRDGVDVLAESGATAIVQPGGSVRDGEVIAAADEHGVAMIFTGTRHFRH